MQRPYFIFNKQMDYRRGYIYNLEFKNGALKPTQTDGYFISRLLDSQEKATVWHRLRVETENNDTKFWKIHIYCSEQDYIIIENKKFNIYELIKDGQINIEQKLNYFEPFYVKTITNSSDILLHDIKGRYVWFYLKAESSTDISEIKFIRIDFPKTSWIEYLPQVYQKQQYNSNFLERFLAIFQNMYEDQSELIENITEIFDPDSADKMFLDWLAEWIAIDNVNIWNENQLRYLIKNAINLYKIRGTQEYLLKLVKLYTGYDAYIMENHYDNFNLNAALMKKLYGSNSYECTLLINTQSLNSNSQQKILSKIIEQACPAHINCRIVLLQQYIFLDKHSYIGINSRLAEYSPLKLDGKSAMQFSKIGN